MLSTSQTRYQRVETALNALVESLSAYNPSLSGLDELLTADEEVGKGSEQLAVHQANYARILSLRQTADSSDDTIKSTVRLLADTRKSLLDVQSAPTDALGREVQVDDSLSYAKFISKTTVPPTFRRPSPKDILSTQAMEPKDEDVPMTEITNGIATPSAAAQDGENHTQDQAANGIGVAALSQETKAMLDPVAQLPFVPWPSQDVIRAGASADIQSMLEDGKDPSTVSSKEEQEAEDKCKAEEAERLKQEEEERARRRRESMFAAGGGHRQVTEDVFDPDEL